MDDVGKKLELLAKCITKQACERWPTYLSHLKDEVTSEAYVAAVCSENRKKPHADDNDLSWPPWQSKYAYGLLIGALQTQNYLPPQEQTKDRSEIFFDSTMLSSAYYKANKTKKRYGELIIESAEIQSNIREHVKWLLRGLEQHERRMMILHVFGDYELAELAEKFKVSRMTITTWKKNALTKMRMRERLRAEENNEN